MSPQTKTSQFIIYFDHPKFCDKDLIVTGDEDIILVIIELWLSDVCAADASIYEDNDSNDNDSDICDVCTFSDKYKV